ncbi:phospholipase D family protein [Rivibacter subsaxonicus]|uniref:phospholipase D family protein n=1 Tax=Rivibacter subsaxonicus TaxID=457575 RepID=UPI0013EE410E|nr:phospholipase D family protein [Rivibacter subsaxonicus]
MLRHSLPAVALAGSLIVGCAGLPPRTPDPPSEVAAVETAPEASPARALEAPAADEARASRVLALDDGLDAFVARVALVRLAKSRLDLQYYIWRDDVTGGLLWHELLQAADRGVRVRALLDDLNQPGDELLAALDAHPNLELRLFNPFAHRNARWIDGLTDFGRINRRMHNKLVLADGRLAITGGRNVGDDYFGADPDLAFADLDALLAGAVLPEFQANFDAFWHSPHSYPLAALGLPAAAAEALAGQRERLEKLAASPEAARYVAALQQAPLAVALRERDARALERAPVSAVNDRPDKIDQRPDRALAAGMLPRLIGALKPFERELCIVSPYFVPGETGVAELARLVGSGVRVRVLTNSLAATDVAAVHAAYAPYRRALLAAGVELWELRPDADRGPALQRPRTLGGSSRASLHAKTIAVDSERVFVGSFNLDPRSAMLNTEGGAVIEARAPAARLCRWFDEQAPKQAWRLQLATDGGLEWVGPDAGYRSDPQAGWWRRALSRVLSWLPIEGMM